MTAIGGIFALVAQLIQFATFYVFVAVIVAVVVVVLLKVLVDLLKLSPFGRFAYHATRPANAMIRHMRDSRFYYPLRRALNFDPAILMILVSAAILCYVVYVVIEYLTTFLWGVADTFVAFGSGLWGRGAWHLIGTILIGVIFYLLALMLIVFVNSLFGLMRRAAFFANKRIRPLLQIFEFGGIFTGWSFLILWIALTFAAVAVRTIFLSNLTGARLV